VQFGNIMGTDADVSEVPSFRFIKVRDFLSLHVGNRFYINAALNLPNYT